MPATSPSVLSPAPDEIETLVASTTGPVIVEVSTKWCPPCRIMRPIVHKLALELAGRATFIEVDGDAAIAFASARAINAFPQMLLFRDGAEVKRIEGFIGFAEITTALREFADAPGSTGPADSAFEAAFNAARERMEAVTQPAWSVIGPAMQEIGPRMDAAEAEIMAELDAGGNREALRQRFEETWQRLTAPIRPQLDAFEQAQEQAFSGYEADMQVAIEGYAAARPRPRPTVICTDGACRPL